MKLRILGIVTLLTMTTLATASHMGSVRPRFHPTDPHVRVGGFQPSMSFYQVGLRPGRNVQPRQDYNMRKRFSNHLYPRQIPYEAQQLRPVMFQHAQAGVRIGGASTGIPQPKGGVAYRDAN